MFLSARPLFVPLNLELVKSILTKDFNHFTDRGVYYNEKDDPLCKYFATIPLDDKYFWDEKIY